MQLAEGQYNAKPTFRLVTWRTDVHDYDMLLQQAVFLNRGTPI